MAFHSICEMGNLFVLLFMVVICNRCLATDWEAEEENLYAKEIAKGDLSQLVGSNQHQYYPNVYDSLSRRFVAQYPYKQKPHYNANVREDTYEDDSLEIGEHVGSIIPKKAPPEIVLAIAAISAKLAADRPPNPADHMISRSSLRSGNYWDSVWKEEVDPKNMLRSNSKQKKYVRPPRTSHGSEPKASALNLVPGTELHTLVSILKKTSPNLIYVINEQQ